MIDRTQKGVIRWVANKGKWRFLAGISYKLSDFLWVDELEDTDAMAASVINISFLVDKATRKKVGLRIIFFNITFGIIKDHLAFTHQQKEELSKTQQEPSLSKSTIEDWVKSL